MSQHFMTKKESNVDCDSASINKENSPNTPPPSTTLLKSPTNREHPKSALLESRPLSSHRDPRRTPLLSRIPFAPSPKSTFSKSTPSAGLRSATRGRDKDITPAYAYKNAETGLLEIRANLPPPLSIVANEDDSVVGLDVEAKSCPTKLALYPIALNGGGAGLYHDPRDFGTENNNTHFGGRFSKNHRIEGSTRAPVMGHVRFHWSHERKRDANFRDNDTDGMKEYDADLEASYSRQRSASDEGSYTRHSFRTFPALVSVNPWKVWENIHNEMSRLAALRTIRAEEESSHVTLARQKNKVVRVSSIYNEDDFDFALVLAPHDAYAFWAKHLDFREEALHFVDDHRLHLAHCQENMGENYDDQNAHNSAVMTKAGGDITQSYPLSPTDTSGLRRRKKVVSTASYSKTSHLDLCSQFNNGISPIPSSSNPTILSPFQIGSGEQHGSRVFSHRKSLFERAVDKLSPPRLSISKLSPSKRRHITPPGSNHHCDAMGTREASCHLVPSGSSRPSTASPHIQRRRWGNAFDKNLLSTPNLTSPPVKSLKKKYGSTMYHAKLPGSGTISHGLKHIASTLDEAEVRAVTSKNKRNREYSASDVVAGNGVMEDYFFSSPGVPRGVAARVNGLGHFLEAMKIGVVVRKHWPRGQSAFVQLFSDNGGDTIQYRFIPDDEAFIALKEQEQRYNGQRRKKKMRLSFGVNEPRQRSDGTLHKDKVDSSVPLPDYMKAKMDREKEMRKNGGIRNALNFTTLKWLNTGVIETKDIVQIQPATHVDPFSKDGTKLGTSSLRQSETKYVKNNAFSLILPSMQGRLAQNYFPSIDLTEKWCEGENKSLYRTFDIEMATEGEYWMILRGFLLLHRDASAGRFSAQRAGGFGSYHRHVTYSHNTEHKNSSNGFIEVLPSKKQYTFVKEIIHKLIGEGSFKKADAVPPYSGTAPPSDYFLGFSSPGTQIWGRLRQAGLETQRLYALDTKKVMIKVRCPVDRLQDVAEALKLKLKTKDGDYAPYREDMLSLFVPTDDCCVSCDDDDARVSSLFRSSDRQKIIDFIIGSRIRDSGAELGPTNPIGKHIKLRVPLHSHARLEALYVCWVLFWKEVNWNHRDGKSLKVGCEKAQSPRSPTDQYWFANGAVKESLEGFEESSAHLSKNDDKIPSIFYRFFIGSFYQPLDSIEEYYGEKVAFYFAWLQHVSFHLIYPSFIGVIVFLCQIFSGKWDHGIRPYFSLFIMIWSFIVMVTWRKRSNALAHRWGTLDYREEEIARPEFKGTEYRICPITKTYVVYYPPWKRWLKMCISIPLTVGFTVLALLGILIFYGNRDIMLANYFSSGDEKSFEFSFSANTIGKTAPIVAVELTSEHLSDPDFWLIIIGFPSVLALILPLLNFCLRRISLWLNEIENHRTEAEYRTHFIIKVFAFRFVCYFAALYYYSFVGVGEPSTTEHGIVRVASTLFAYLTIAHWWNICINLLFPLLLYRWRVYRERLHLKTELRLLQLQEIEESTTLNKTNMTEEQRFEKKKELLNKRILLEHAQVNIWEEMMLPEHDSFVDYLFAVTQFAYVTCFSVVLPITPLVVLVNHIVNIRLDAFKLCRGRRRPLALKTGGIGVWNHVLHIVTVIAVLTNCSLMALTSSSFSWLAKQIGTLGVFALSIAWEHLMLLLKYIMQVTSTRLPESVENEIRRKKYDQERKRYMSLRARKRSKGSNGSKLPSDSNQNISDSKSDGSDKADKAPKPSRSPPMQQSLTVSAQNIISIEAQPQVFTADALEICDGEKGKVGLEVHNSTDFVNSHLLSRQSPLQNTQSHCNGRLDGEVIRKANQQLNTSKRGLVNVKGLTRHSPERNENICYSGNTVTFEVGGVSKFTQNDSSFIDNYPKEDIDPNLDVCEAAILNEQAKQSVHQKISSFNDLKKIESTRQSVTSKMRRRGIPSIQREKSSNLPGDPKFSKTLKPNNSILSPGSSISTIPGIPTPCKLCLESDEDSINSLESTAPTSRYYQHASAPPLSPDGDNFLPNENKLNDQNIPHAKWAVYHSFQYNLSEKSANVPMPKKKSY